MFFNIQGSNYPDVKVFYNFWANGDIISGPLSGKIPVILNVQDIMVDENINDQRDLSGCYFWHTFTTLGDDVTTDPVHIAYLISIGINDITPTRNIFINQVISLIQTACGN